MGKDVEPAALDVFQDFVVRAGNNEHKDAPIYLGIDPGSTGALALLCKRTCGVADIPVIVLKVKRSKKCSAKERKATGQKTKTIIGTTTTFDLASICRLFNTLKPLKHRVVVTLEEVPTSLGPGKHHADIILNRAWALWPLFLHSRGYEVEHVRPGVWKQRMGLKGKDKEHSRRIAQGLFPKARLFRKKDHDRAEAILLAEYTRRRRSAN